MNEFTSGKGYINEGEERECGGAGAWFCGSEAAAVSQKLVKEERERETDRGDRRSAWRKQGKKERKKERKVVYLFCICFSRNVEGGDEPCHKCVNVICHVRTDSFFVSESVFVRI